VRALRVGHNQPFLFAFLVQLAPNLAPAKLPLALEVSGDYCFMVLSTFKFAAFGPSVFRIDVGEKNGLNPILPAGDNLDLKKAVV
jgi:hypothetical protein